MPDEKRYILALSTTAHAGDRDSYATPIRQLNGLVIRGYVVRNQYDTEQILTTYAHESSYIFYDIEKKVPPVLPRTEFNLERYILESEFAAKSLPFKPNDITVSAVLASLVKQLDRRSKGLGGVQACIIGIGNVGFKTALSLVESGVDVHLLSRNVAKSELLATTINIIKPGATIAVARSAQNVEDGLAFCQVLITCASESSVVRREQLIAAKKLEFVLDVGKKNLSPDAIQYLNTSMIPVQRLSVTDSLIRHFSGTLDVLEAGLEPVGRGTFCGRKVVSGGVLGLKGDWIVDNYLSPKQWYGIADGQGGFARRRSSG